MKVRCLREFPPALFIEEIREERTASGEIRDVTTKKSIPAYIAGKTYHVFGILQPRGADIQFVLSPETAPESGSASWLAVGRFEDFEVVDPQISSEWTLSQYRDNPYYAFSACYREWGDLLTFKAALESNDQASISRFHKRRSEDEAIP